MSNKVKWRHKKTGKLVRTGVVQTNRAVVSGRAMTLDRVTRIMVRAGYERAGSRA